jgi:hypothetical protein
LGPFAGGYPFCVGGVLGEVAEEGAEEEVDAVFGCILLVFVRERGEEVGGKGEGKNVRSLAI